MAPKESTKQLRRGWPLTDAAAAPSKVLTVAQELMEGIFLPPPVSVGVTLDGSPTGLRITGDPAAARADFEELPDREFISATINATFPNEGNLTLQASFNFITPSLSVAVQNTTPDRAEHLFSLLRDRFPRAAGPSFDELERKEKDLLRLKELLDRALALEQEAHASLSRTKEAEGQALTTSEKLTQTSNEATGLRDSAKAATDASSQAQTESTQRLAEIRNLKAQVEADRETVQKGRDDVGAIQAQIRQFFLEIDAYKKDMTAQKQRGEEFLKSFTDQTSAVINQNQALQEEIEIHLLKAVGASLFGSFEKRKQNIVKSKWTWAALTALAIAAQVVAVIWLAREAGLDSSADAPFYARPMFIMKATISVPIVFLIGFCIRQYGRERDVEEIYAFKSALSFSLAPYLDLVRELVAKGAKDSHTEFVIKTVGQIFESPLERLRPERRASQRDVTLYQDLLEKAIRIIEKSGG